MTFTDILQFFTFTAVMPIIFIAIWKDIDQEHLGNLLSNSPLFDYHAMFDIYNPRFYSSVGLFLMLALHPSSTLNPTAVQRISMSKHVGQARKAFTIAGLVSVVILLMICCTSVALFSSNPDLDPNRLLVYIINTYTFTGFKSLMAICIMALIMSTADSYLNSSAVLFTNDIVNAMGFKSKSNGMQLFHLRISGFFIGLCAFIFALKINSLFGILMMTLSFYTPIVCAPFVLAMLGFYTNQKAVLAGMAAGLLTSLLAPDLSEQYWGLPGLFTNLAVIVLAHFILGKPKGFSENKEERGVAAKPLQGFVNLLIEIKDFNLSNFLSECVPHKKSIFIAIMSFSLSSVVLLACTLNQALRAEYNDIINITCLVSVIIISMICTYTIYPFLHYRKYLVGGAWILSLGWLLIIAPGLFILMHKFSTASLSIFMINIITFLLLIPWQASLPITIISTYLSIKIYRLFTYPNFELTTNISISEMQFKISCLLLLISAMVLAFLKPKQEEHAQAEGMIGHLNDMLEYQKNEISDLSSLKQTFLRNLQHETNTPVTGIYSMSQALADCYDKL